MSGKPRAKRAAKPKSDDDSESENGVQVNVRGRPSAKNVSQNEIIKSKLTMIVDLLTCDDEVDERALRRNTSMATKHLNEIIKNL